MHCAVSDCPILAAVHELAASEVPRAFLFRGSREVNAQEVAKLLGLGLVQFKRPAGMPGPSAGTAGIGRFLLPYSECDYTLESIIDDLQVIHLWGRLPLSAHCAVLSTHREDSKLLTWGASVHLCYKKVL